MKRKTFEQKVKEFIGEEYYPGTYPDIIMEKFIEVCQIILFSDNSRSVAKSYDEFFKQISYESRYTGISIAQDVMKKIFNDVDSDKLKLDASNYYSPFQRLIAFINNHPKAIGCISLMDEDVDERKIIYIYNILKKDLI